MCNQLPEAKTAILEDQIVFQTYKDVENPLNIINVKLDFNSELYDFIINCIQEYYRNSNEMQNELLTVIDIRRHTILQRNLENRVNILQTPNDYIINTKTFDDSKFERSPLINELYSMCLKENTLTYQC